MIRGQDSHFMQLAEIATRLESKYQTSDSAWRKSPFGWIKKKPSRTIGAIVEALVECWLVANDLEVKRSGDSDADRIVEGIRVEIKGSTLWKSGAYKFQQVRDQNYEFLICLGISPHNAQCWVIPKSVIMPLWEAGVIKTQHGGQGGRDTAWFTVCPQNPPDWLTPHGGNLTGALDIVREFGRQQ